MLFRLSKNTVFIVLLTILSCGNSVKSEEIVPKVNSKALLNDLTKIIVGADQFENYNHLLKGKNIAVVANQTSVVGKEQTHLIDFLISKNIAVKKVFAPEHGFRGTADAGEHIKDGIDSKTGIPLISLYGSNKKPTKEQLKDIELIVFDIQDVGARFYTYISTLHYIMEACAEHNIPLLILDRPNPNIHYIDGPLLETAHRSFVGMHPVPIVHGMTIAEYAKMINGQKWLNNNLQTVLHIVPIKNYTRKTAYSLPIKPSPNLPNDQSINLYPSLCFFEGTPISEGRGTEMQFQIFGAPSLPKSSYSFSFTPKPNEGAKNPKFKGQLCYGTDLRNHPKLDKINLEWIIETYQHYDNKDKFFTNFFNTLAGTSKLKEQIIKGWSAEKIRSSWKSDLEKYDAMRKQYFLYP